MLIRKVDTGDSLSNEVPASYFAGKPIPAHTPTGTELSTYDPATGKIVTGPFAEKQTNGNDFHYPTGEFGKLLAFGFCSVLLLAFIAGGVQTAEKFFPKEQKRGVSTDWGAEQEWKKANPEVTSGDKYAKVRTRFSFWWTDGKCRGQECKQFVRLEPGMPVVIEKWVSNKVLIRIPSLEKKYGQHLQEVKRENLSPLKDGDILYPLPGDAKTYGGSSSIRGQVVPPVFYKAPTKPTSDNSTTTKRPVFMVSGPDVSGYRTVVLG